MRLSVPCKHNQLNLDILTRTMCDAGSLAALCALPLSDCPAPGEHEDDMEVDEVEDAPNDDHWKPRDIVVGALWSGAQCSSVQELVLSDDGSTAAADGKSGGPKANYYDCLYAFFMTYEMFVEAAEAQDALRARYATSERFVFFVTNAVVCGA